MHAKNEQILDLHRQCSRNGREHEYRKFCSGLKIVKRKCLSIFEAWASHMPAHRWRGEVHVRQQPSVQRKPRLHSLLS